MSNQENNPESQDRKKKIMRVTAVIVIIVVIAALVAGSAMKRRAAAPAPVAAETVEGCKPGFLFSETSGKPCPKDVTTVDTDTKAKTAAAAPGGYEEAIRMYAGKVVVFDATCKPMPAAPAFALGDRVLVANNSDKEATLSLGGRTEKLDGYHYFTVSLKAPGEFKAQCNGTDAATVMVK